VPRRQNKVLERRSIVRSASIQALTWSYLFSQKLFRFTINLGRVLLISRFFDGFSTVFGGDRSSDFRFRSSRNDLVPKPCYFYSSDNLSSDLFSLGDFQAACILGRFPPNPACELQVAPLYFLEGIVKSLLSGCDPLRYTNSTARIADSTTTNGGGTRLERNPTLLISFHRTFLRAD
jgi:hypothetical protein